MEPFYDFLTLLLSGFAISGSIMSQLAFIDASYPGECRAGKNAIKILQESRNLHSKLNLIPIFYPVRCRLITFQVTLFREFEGFNNSLFKTLKCFMSDHYHFVRQ